MPNETDDHDLETKVTETEDTKSWEMTEATYQELAERQKALEAQISELQARVPATPAAEPEPASEINTLTVISPEVPAEAQTEAPAEAQPKGKRKRAKKRLNLKRR